MMFDFICNNKVITCLQGCGKVFQDTRWLVKNVHSPNQKTTGPINRNCQWEGKNSRQPLVSGFEFSLAKSEFYLNLASWRVVIRTHDACLLLF
jgi:hypothetical protein